MRNLTIPCALLLMGAVACDSVPPTSPDSGPPQFNVALAGCPAGFVLTTYTDVINVDRNKDGYVCQKVLSKDESGRFR